MKQHWLISLLALGLFLLVYIPGKIRASGNAPELFQSGLNYYIEYLISLEVLQITPSTDIEDWLAQQELPLPPDATAYLGSASVTINAPQEYQEHWEAWLDEHHPGQWEHAIQERFDLAWQVKDRMFGILCVTDRMEDKAPSEFTALFYGFNENDRTFYQSEFIGLTSQVIWYVGPAWPLTLALTLMPALFFYFLRRPLWRVATAWQRTRTSPKS